MTTIAQQEFALIQGAAANDFPLVKAFADSFSSPTTTIAQAVGLLQTAVAQAQDPDTIAGLQSLASAWYAYIGSVKTLQSQVNAKQATPWVDPATIVSASSASSTSSSSQSSGS